MIIGIGTDLVDIRRVSKVFDKYEKRVKQRLFTEQEQEYCEKQAQPLWAYAKRFAAKEAVFKAFSGKFMGRWTDVEIIRKNEGPPTLVLGKR
jgi:holo-[acyl-carrier protein] synthase